MKSWKTTIGGLLSGCGLAFAQFFPEHSKFGMFAAAIGSVLLGLAARDNNVTSEQAGAGRPTQPGKITSLLFTLGIVALIGYGCASGPQRVAFNTLYSVEQSTTSAVDVYDSLVISGAVPTNDVPRVSRAFNLWQKSFTVALDAVQFNTNAIAPPNLVVESQDLINLINKISKGKAP